MIHLESLLVVRSVLGASSVNRVVPNLKWVGASSEDEVRRKVSKESGLMDVLESWFSSHIDHSIKSLAVMALQCLRVEVQWECALESWPRGHFVCS